MYHGIKCRSGYVVLVNGCIIVIGPRLGMDKYYIGGGLRRRRSES